MAKSARQQVFDGMELLPEALAPFVERRLESSLKGHWQARVKEKLTRLRVRSDGHISWDQSSLLNAMNLFWMEAFKVELGRAERGIVNELLDVRNKLSHNESFTYDDAERALDSLRRLMQAISASQAASELEKMRDSILRTKFSELARNQERRKSSHRSISVESVGGLIPWREVMEPHHDVASGDFLQAEFAADLAKVYNGSASSEYRDPVEFFSRTYLTAGLRSLLLGAAKRLSGNGGDPVVELQTPFGGGKTHSMLAMFHLVGGSKVEDLPEVDQLFSSSEFEIPSKVNRAVLVGTSRGPQDVVSVDGNRTVCTTWGELAWQLGGAEAFDMISKHNDSGTAPGSKLLEEMLRRFAPAIILVDEWVAYLRQIYKNDGLPSGSFDANLTFVQSLTEAVKASPQVLLVASLPASQIEVGGEGGQEALDRLKQTFSRVESSWRSANQEESYEIVRRRLFKEIPSDMHHHRDNTVKQFAKMYRENSNDFPTGCSEEDYRKKMEKAYPIHPELFDQLYVGWGSLEKFQRTRGVLRLMAQVIHDLWMNSDPSVVILPGGVTLDSERVEPELLRYIDPTWQSIIAGDVDGATSVPYRIDQSAPNLNRCSATRRVARAVFLGTAPTHNQANTGIDDKRINLGVIQPGERPAIFGDALRRLSNQAMFIHTDQGRYWYTLSASVNRIAMDRADQLDENFVIDELDKALNTYVGGLAASDRGHFRAAQTIQSDVSDVPDEPGGIRVIFINTSYSHNGKSDSNAMQKAAEVLEKGRLPRIYRNNLVFVAADRRKVDGLIGAQRSALAWNSVVSDADHLNLTPVSKSHAERKSKEARDVLRARIREAWCYLIYPMQDGAHKDLHWECSKVPTQGEFLVNASDRMINDQAIWSELGPENLNRYLEKFVWNEHRHLLLRDLVDHFNRWVYLPRLVDRRVLANSVQSSIGATVPGPFGYAERWSDEEQSYFGLRVSQATGAQVVIDSDSVIVRSDVAKEFEVSQDASKLSDAATPDDPMSGDHNGGHATSSATLVETTGNRFQGVVMISSDRPVRDFGKIVEAIVDQVSILPNASVSIKVEIDAEAPSGFDKATTRTLIENARTLKFIDRSIT